MLAKTGPRTDADLDFIRKLPLTIRLPDHGVLLVHAGLVPGRPLLERANNTLIQLQLARIFQPTWHAVGLKTGCRHWESRRSTLVSDRLCEQSAADMVMLRLLYSKIHANLDDIWLSVWLSPTLRESGENRRRAVHLPSQIRHQHGRTVPLPHFELCHASF